VFFDTAQQRVIISGGLVVGEIGGEFGNSIDKAALNAIIAGGLNNHIL
jgi:hypothetical protein